jgi:hypothetical protein
MTAFPVPVDVSAARGIQLCLFQLAREARSMGLTFAAAHMDVAALEIADSIGDAARDGQLLPAVANDGGAATANRRVRQ